MNNVVVRNELMREQQQQQQQQQQLHALLLQSRQAISLAVTVAVQNQPCPPLSEKGYLPTIGATKSGIARWGSASIMYEDGLGNFLAGVETAPTAPLRDKNRTQLHRTGFPKEDRLFDGKRKRRSRSFDVILVLRSWVLLYAV